MKILAIRGMNLASLSSTFEVDFQSEPLVSAGLFAITGPTGSGKSTLLDALCLALYEKTPRLTGVGRSGDIPDVGDNGITPSDVRTILRRGAAEGFAEVDFVGIDGVAYRSRWTVRRARIKTDGKMQNSEVSLVRILDGQALGDHRKTETLRLIEKYIGLSFEQFTRAVLLAQNDFSAFLKASDDERAELLQTLTGTETFTSISIQAFERMKAEKEQLLRLQGKLKDQEPLTPESRATKASELKVQEDSAKTLEQQKALLESHLRWYEQLGQLTMAEAEATQKLEVATTEKLLAGPRYEQLSLVDRVQLARPLWVEQVRLTQALEAAAKANDAAKVAMEASQEQLTLHQAENDSALHQQNLAEAAKSTSQGDIDAARALDASIATITPQYEVAENAQKAAFDHLNEEQGREAQTKGKVEEANEALSTAQKWLVANESVRPLAEGWQRWEAIFAQAQLHVGTKSKTAKRVAELESAAKAVEASVGQAALVLNDAVRSLEADSAQLKTIADECAGFDLDKLSGEKRLQEQARDQLQSAAQLWQKHSELHRQKQLQIEQHKTHTAVLEKSESDLQLALQNLPLMERELQATEESLHLANLAASESADSLRDALQPAKPCPVCGAVEHPYVTQTPAMDAVLKSLQKLVMTKRAALRDVERKGTLAQATKASAEAAMALAADTLVQLESSLSALVATRADHALYAQIEMVPEVDRSTWLAERQSAVRGNLEELTQQEALYRAAITRKDAAQIKVNAANAALAQAKETSSGLDTQQKTTVQALENERFQLVRIEQQLSAQETQLDEALPGQQWRGPWGKDPSGFVAQCKSNAQAWMAQQGSATALTGRIAALTLEIAACEKSCLQASNYLKAQSEAYSVVASSLQSYRLSRNALFAGRAVTEVEAELNAAIHAAKLSLAVSQEALNNAKSEVTRTTEAARQSGVLLDQLHTALQAAQSGLETWLVNFNVQSKANGAQSDLAPDGLASLLQIGPDWVAGERQALQLLDNSLTTATAVRATRAQSRIEHEAAKTVEDDLDVLQDHLVELLGKIGTANETLSALRLELAKDDERLVASEALRVSIDKQAAISRVWSQLGDLIGSSDGKKFRNFAQQLTLDILLSYGNQHLQSLTRRYRLQRIKDSLGLLVVDQDMGDEVRSVHSLSGGESFLVSLALALGLASLSSHRVRVESLFIDEGFGSLDADSLGIAMDALDNLQSQGRKVGVISHVHEMTERIGTRVQVQRQSGGLSRIVVC